MLARQLYSLRPTVENISQFLLNDRNASSSILFPALFTLDWKMGMGFGKTDLCKEVGALVFQPTLRCKKKRK